MRVLFVTPRTLWPPQSGGRARAFHLAKIAGAGTALTIVGFRDADATEGAAQHLEFAEKLIEVPMPRLWRKRTLLRGLWSVKPFPLLNYYSGEMEGAIRRVLSEGSFDLVHCDTTLVSEYSRLWRGIPCIYDWHNIDSELMRRFSEGQANRLKRIYARVTAAKYVLLENRLLQTDHHIVCSDRERELLLGGVREASVSVVENGVDCGRFRAAGAGEKSTLLFVGSMDYHANIEAVLWFERSIWPSIRESLPHLRLEIVGSRPVDAIRALASDSVRVSGTVANVAPYYGNALAAIVPLRTGSGTRLKILEAMAAGVPVISTRIGAEGIPFEDGGTLLLAETKDEWVRAVSTLADSPERRERIAENALEMVRAQFDWACIGRKLLNVYELAVHTR